MIKHRALRTLMSSLAAGALSIASADALTPSQNAAAELRAKTEAAARQRTTNDAKARSETQSKAQSANAARAKAQSLGNQAVHNETKRRLEATRSAAALNARIRAAQADVTAHGREKYSAAGRAKGDKRPVQATRAKAETKPAKQ